MKKIIENKEEIILENDIKENNNIDYTTPVVKVMINDKLLFQIYMNLLKIYLLKLVKNIFMKMMTQYLIMKNKKMKI